MQAGVVLQQLSHLIDGLTPLDFSGLREEPVVPDGVLLTELANSPCGGRDGANRAVAPEGLFGVVLHRSGETLNLGLILVQPLEEDGIARGDVERVNVTRDVAVLGVLIGREFRSQPLGDLLVVDGGVVGRRNPCHRHQKDASVGILVDEVEVLIYPVFSLD